MYRETYLTLKGMLVILSSVPSFLKRSLNFVILFFLFNSTLSFAESLRDYETTFGRTPIGRLIPEITAEWDGLPVQPEPRLLDGHTVDSIRRLVDQLWDYLEQTTDPRDDTVSVGSMTEEMLPTDTLLALAARMNELIQASSQNLNPEQFSKLHFELYNTMESALIVFIIAWESTCSNRDLYMNLSLYHKILIEIVERYRTVLITLHSMIVADAVQVLVPVSVPTYIPVPLFLLHRVFVAVPIGYRTVLTPGVLFIPKPRKQ